MNDEFAQDVSEFDTLAEYKDSIRAELVKEKEAKARIMKEEEAMKQIVESSEMDIPSAMIDTQCENMIEEFAQKLAQSGLSVEQYMQFSGMTIPQLREQVRPEALTRIQSNLVLEAIAKAENLEASDEDVDAELEQMAKQYNMEFEKLKEYMGDAEKEVMKKDIVVTKAVDLILEKAVEVQKAE